MKETPSYTPLSKEQILAIKEGDVIERMLGFTIPMYLVVSEVDKNIIRCGHWDFDRNTGIEIDPDISVPVSYIRRVLTEEQKKQVKEGAEQFKLPYP